MIRFLAILFLCLASGTASAAAAPDLRDFDATVAALRSDQRASYDALDARYRAAVAAAPNDMELVISRCRFLEKYRASAATPATKAKDDEIEQCRAEVQRRWPTAIAARIYRFEYKHDEATRKEAEATWEGPEKLPDPLNARLAKRLYELYKDVDADDAGYYAVQAVRYGDASLLPEAIRSLDERGKREQALKLASKSQVAETGWQAFERMKALIALGEPKAARRELERSLAAGLDIVAATEVRVYLADQDLAAANAAAKRMADGSSAREMRFELALANGDLKAARDQLTSVPDFDTGFQRYAKVLAKDRWSAFYPPMLPYTFVVLALLVFMGVALALILAPVHYRGLALRLRNRTPKPLFEGIGLRHAWLALFLSFLLPVVVVILYDPSEIAGLMLESVEMNSPFILDGLTSLAIILVLLPWMRRFGVTPTDARRLLSWRTLGMVLGCFLLMQAIDGVYELGYHALFGEPEPNVQTKRVAGLVDDGVAKFGVTATVFLLAVITPIIEEGVFRGMLLGGMARHIGFGWANTLQSLMFVAVHPDPPGYGAYMSTALLAGWLTQRYRSLLPAMLLHGVMNAYATLMNHYT